MQNPLNFVTGATFSKFIPLNDLVLVTIIIIIAHIQHHAIDNVTFIHLHGNNALKDMLFKNFDVSPNWMSFIISYMELYPFHF